MRRPAPGVTADDLVKIALADRPGAGFFSFPDYLEYQKQTKTLRALTAFTNRRVTMTLDRGSSPAFLTAVDANYFDTVGVSMARGRAFSGADSQSLGASGLTAIISDRTWKNSFDGAEDVIGRDIEVNGIPATIVGVAPPQFQGTMLAERADLWLPLLAFWRVLMPDSVQRFAADRNTPSVDLIGRLAPGRRVAEAQAEFSTLEARLRLADPSSERHPVSVVRYGEGDDPRSRVSLPCGGVLEVLVEKLEPVCEVQAHLRELESARLGRRRLIREVDLASGARSLLDDREQGVRVEREIDRVRLRIGAAQRLLLAG